MKIIEKGELIFLCKFLEKNMDVGFGENWFFFFLMDFSYKNNQLFFFSFSWASGVLK